MRGPGHPRHFTDEFRRQTVDLHSAGKPKREAMDEYGLGKSTVERRVRSINATGSPRAADNRTPEQNRIPELERGNRRLRMEVDVLKQAAPIYAREWGAMAANGGRLLMFTKKWSDLCQDFGHGIERNHAAIGIASGLGSGRSKKASLGSVRSKKSAMASAGTL